MTTDSARSVAARRVAWLSFTVALALLATGFLVGPRVPDAEQAAHCVGNVDLPGPFGFGLNCDAPVFMSLARAPSGLLRPDCTRQSRPGLVFLASALHAPLSLLGDPDRPVARFGPIWNGTPSYVSASFDADYPAFIAYVLLNAAMLLGVFWCLRGITMPLLRPRASSVVLVVAIGVVLVSNDVTKAFFWAPHTQLLNILGPVAAIHAAVRTRQGALTSTRFAVGLGLGLGLAMTVYGVFVITVPAVGIAALPTLWRTRSMRLAGATLANLGIVVVLTVLPSALWYRYVVQETGQFFNQELAMGHVVWMFAAWSVGPAHLLSEWLGNLGELAAMAGPQAIAPAAIALGTLLLAVEARALRPAVRRAGSTALLSLLVCALAGAFYASVGFLTARLAFAMVPALVVFAAAGAASLASALDDRRRWVLALGCAIVAVASGVYAVVKDGPYS